MDLFKLLIDLDSVHPNFRSILGESKAPEREELLRWANGFPNRDGKFVKEFQTSFNSSFWEIYLHALFRALGFEFDWTHSTPDFSLKYSGTQLTVEATTANTSEGKPAEWEHLLKAEELKDMRFAEMNRESIIRLSNSIISKWKKYKSSYSSLPHVSKRPFILAVAPFEQPEFNLQYNRPIVALLYDYYVDEDAYLDDRSGFPEGPPGRNLGFVKKDNGSEIALGFFTDESLSEISAIIFSCTATWGKVDAMTANPNVFRTFHTVWGSPPNGVPEKRSSAAAEYSETIYDGLQVYHNPYARYPLDPSLFRREGIVQVFGDRSTKELKWEGEDSCLMYRLAHSTRSSVD